MEEQKFSLSGLLPIAFTGPGFATPLFVCGKSIEEYIQKIDENGKVEGFTLLNSPENLPVIRSVAPVQRAVGNPALYGFSAPGLAPFVAEKSKIIEIAHEIVPTLESFPFVKSQLLKFVGGKKTDEFLIENTKEILGSRSNFFGELDDFCSYIINNGSVFQEEVIMFSMNPIFSIQNATNFFRNLLIDEPEEEFGDIENWVNNTTLGFTDRPEFLLHYTKAEAVYMSYLASLRYNSPLAEIFSSSGQQSLTFSSSIEGGMQRESRRYFLLQKCANISPHHLTFQCIESVVQGNFLDLRSCTIHDGINNFKLMSSAGTKIEDNGYDGVVFSQPNVGIPNATTAVSYSLKNIKSIVSIGIFNLSYVSAEVPTWTNAFELV